MIGLAGVQEIVMPSLGMAPGDVYLAEWLVNPGDTVEAGAIVAHIETDKAELSLEAPGGGVLGRHYVNAGASAPAGSTIAWVLQPGEVDPGDRPEGEDTLTSAVVSDEVQTAEERLNTRGHGSPDALAERSRNQISGELEPHTQSPRLRAASARARQAVPAPAANRATSGDRYRSAIAKAVAQSWAEIPHFAVAREIRTERLREVLRSFRLLDGRVTFTDVLIKIYALSLVEHFDTTSISLGLAVATPNGVSIPVLPSVATSDLTAIARLRRAAIERATESRRNDDDALIPHSTLSNLGAFGVDNFTGIVPTGQTSILTVGAAMQRPVVEDGALVVGESMNTTINVDHRFWDGQHAAAILQRLAAFAAEPAMLLTLSATNGPRREAPSQ